MPLFQMCALLKELFYSIISILVVLLVGWSGERHIRQMQYLAWPDHGVPDDSSDFLGFVMRVRQNRTGMVEPTVVHCR